MVGDSSRAGLYPPQADCLADQLGGLRNHFKTKKEDFANDEIKIYRID
jgi:hypothetical protein